MRYVANIVVALLLMVSVGINVAEAADLLPCLDGSAAHAATLMPPIAPGPTPPRTSGGMQHCTAISPLSAAILADQPIEPCCSVGHDGFALPADVAFAGRSPSPRHGPPRA